MDNKPEEKRKPINISNDNKAYLFTLTDKDITYSTLKELFAITTVSKDGMFEDIPARFNTNDTFLLPENKLYNLVGMRTTVGRYIFNLLVLHPTIIKHLGYVNEVLNGGNIKKLEKRISNLLLDDVIKTTDVIEYIQRIQWLGFRTSRFLNASLTYNLLVPNDAIEEKKKELIEKYQNAIKNGVISEISKMEKELLDFSRLQNENIPDMQIYDSGGRGSYGNNYKNTSLMRGGIKNMANPDKISVSTASLVDGIPPDEIATYADMIVQASYSRAVGTQDGGYEAKKITSSFQDVKLDEAGSDCGTKLTLKLLLTKDNKNLFINRYIVVKDTLILLTEENIDKYVDKYINLRSPMLCNSKHYCSKCMGELYYKLGGIEYIGLLIQRICTKILNQSLKLMHNATISVIDVNIEDYIS